MKYPLFLCLCLTLLWGCGPKTETEKPKADASEETQEPAPRTPPTPISPPAPEPSATTPVPPVDATKASGEPDWKARYEEVKTLIADKYKAPKMGTVLTVGLKGGSKQQGKLTAMDDKGISLSLGEDGEMTLQRGDLDDRTRSLLFKEDALHFYAVRRVKQEKEKWDARELTKKIATQKAEKLAAVKERKNAVPINDPRDRSVWQVKEYLKGHLRDYNNTKFVRWYPVEKDEKGYRVRCIYRTQTQTLGISEERMMFFMDPNGKVYRQAPFKVENK